MNLLAQQADNNIQQEKKKTPHFATTCTNLLKHFTINHELNDELFTLHYYQKSKEWS